MPVDINEALIQKKTVRRAASTLPATAQTPYFRVSGKIRLLSLIGEVTDTIQTQACDLDIWANPTVGDDVALCGVNNISADAIGTMYTPCGVFATALTATTSGAAAVASQIPPPGILIAAGTIDIKTAATNTGSVKWELEYIPIDDGATVVAI